MRRLLAVFLALAACAQTTRTTARAAQFEQLDILLVILDDVSHDQLVSPDRPNLIALAQRGFAFLNCHAMPLCSPSRRTLITGEYVTSGQAGVVCGLADEWSMPAGSLTLAEELQGHAAGYFGKLHWRAADGHWELSPQAQGFDVWRAGSPSNVISCGGTDYWQWLRVDDGETRETLSEYQPTSARQALASWWLATPSPKLAVYAPQLAHAPLHRPPAAMLPDGYPPTPGSLAKYEAMLVAVDTEIGLILDAIDLDTTVVVVVADNGSADEVAAIPGKAKGTTYEGGTHVSLLMAGPGIPVGQSSALVSIVDIFPTLLGEDTEDGRDLHRLMDGSATSVHQYILAGSTENPGSDVCVRSLRYKLRRTGVGEEFYDLLLDPLEITNEIANPAHAARIASMGAWLDANLP